MTGAVSASTIALSVAAGAAVAGTAYSIYSGEQQKSAQADALKQQQQAQREATERARGQQQKAEQAQNAANAKSPDVAGIMEAAGKAAQGGPSGTMLTGPSGVSQADLTLGKNTLLGG